MRLQSQNLSIPYARGEQNSAARTFFLVTGNILASVVIAIVLVVAIAPALGMRIMSLPSLYLLVAIPLALRPLLITWLTPVALAIVACLFTGNVLLRDKRGVRMFSIIFQLLGIGCFAYLYVTTTYQIRPIGMGTAFSRPAVGGDNSRNDAKGTLDNFAEECNLYAEDHDGLFPPDRPTLMKFMIDKHHVGGGSQAAEYDRIPLEYYGQGVHIPAPSEPVVDRYNTPDRFIDGDLITWIWPKPLPGGGRVVAIRRNVCLGMGTPGYVVVIPASDFPDAISKSNRVRERESLPLIPVRSATQPVGRLRETEKKDIPY